MTSGSQITASHVKKNLVAGGKGRGEEVNGRGNP